MPKMVTVTLNKHCHNKTRIKLLTDTTGWRRYKLHIRYQVKMLTVDMQFHNTWTVCPLMNRRGSWGGKSRVYENPSRRRLYHECNFSLLENTEEKIPSLGA